MNEGFSVGYFIQGNRIIYDLSVLWFFSKFLPSLKLKSWWLYSKEKIFLNIKKYKNIIFKYLHGCSEDFKKKYKTFRSYWVSNMI